jgi:hypothetical protein
MGKGFMKFGLNPRARYQLGWFGAGDLLDIQALGRYTLGLVDGPLAGGGNGGGLKRAAFVRSPGATSEGDGLWLSFVGTQAASGAVWNGLGSVQSGGRVEVLNNTRGLFIRKQENLIDCSRQQCAGSSVNSGSAWADSAWSDGEMSEVTLNSAPTSGGVSAGASAEALGGFEDQQAGIYVDEVAVAADGHSVSKRTGFEVPACAD